MQYITLDIPPGVFRTGTEYKSRGRFYDSQLWRWFSGEQRPVGGWVQRSRGTTLVEGSTRALVTWRDNDNKSWAGIGTHSHLYAMTSGGYIYDITPSGYTVGRPSATASGAYGSGVYGSGFYGFGVPDEAVYSPATVWSLDIWGENLVGCTIEDGNIYEWVPNVALDASAITGAPTARAVVVTAERIMMALGADGDPRLVRNSGLQDNTDWTETTTNYARQFPLQTVGQLMCGRRVNGGTLLMTDVDAWLATFYGQPYVYTYEKVGSDCGVIAQGAIATVDSQAIWMGQNGFFQFNGLVQPVSCDVHDYIFSDLNINQSSKITATHNSLFNEIRWDYPSASSNENDRYVVYNYKEGHWAIGQMSRLCGCDQGAFDFPMMIDASGLVWDHERGMNHGGLLPYAESGPSEIGTGDQTLMVSKIVPDEKALGDVEVTFFTRIYPMGAETTVGPYPLTQNTDCRLSARQVSARLTAADNVDFRVGSFRFAIVERGKR